MFSPLAKLILLAGGALLLLSVSLARPMQPTAIPEPPNAVAAWAYVQQCSHMPIPAALNPHRIHWYKDNLLQQDPVEGLLGEFIYPDTIILDQWHTNVKRIIAHELLHYAIHFTPNQLDSVNPHPLIPFYEPCELMPAQWSSEDH